MQPIENQVYLQTYYPVQSILFHSPVEPSDWPIERKYHVAER